MAVAFLKYLGVFLPSLAETNFLVSLEFFFNTVQIVAIASILFLTVLNIFGIRLGAIVQNVFTITKAGSLILLIMIACIFGNGSGSNFVSHAASYQPEILSMSFFAAFTVMMSKSLFAYDAWNSITFTA